MVSNTSEIILGVICGTAMALAVLVAAASFAQYRELRKQCEAKGGVMISGVDRNVCVPRGVLL